MNAKACTEVCEILKYIPDEAYKKIPKEFINVIEKNKDSNYQFIIDSSKDIENQQLLRETKVILAIIYKNYWATIEEKIRINKKIKNDIIYRKHKKKN